MARPITGKLNVTKIDKEHLFKGKSGTYLDIVVFENDEPDSYGNTHVVYQGVSKEQREAGVKGKIIGNLKFPDAAPPARRPAPSQRPKPPSDPDLDSQPDDCPF